MANRINYENIISSYPWIITKNQHAVISPDADGMICGLFVSYFLNWDIVGYYDNGKNLILKKGISARDCIFLDTEIYRKEIRSCGHHINLYRNNEIPVSWDNYSNCLNPNNLRGRSLKNNFRLKYPMGTIHLLLSIFGYKMNVEFPKAALFPILQADGTINRFIDKYADNLIDWLEYLGISDKNNSLHKIIHGNKIDLFEFSKDYVRYVQYYVKNKKDKIPISDANGLITTSFNKSKNKFSKTCKKQVQEYLAFVSNKTGWKHIDHNWLWDNFNIYKFTKKTCRPGVRNYNEAVSNNFLSLAITATDTMEYTIEEPDKLP